MEQKDGQTQNRPLDFRAQPREPESAKRPPCVTVRRIASCCIARRRIATFRCVLHLRGREVVAFYFHAFGWRSCNCITVTRIHARARMRGRERRARARRVPRHTRACASAHVHAFRFLRVRRKNAFAETRHRIALDIIR